MVIKMNEVLRYREKLEEELSIIQKKIEELDAKVALLMAERQKLRRQIFDLVFTGRCLERKNTRRMRNDRDKYI